jgi:hypothetical protein
MNTYRLQAASTVTLDDLRHIELDLYARVKLGVKPFENEEPETYRARNAEHIRLNNNMLALTRWAIQNGGPRALFNPVDL